VYFFPIKLIELSIDVPSALHADLPKVLLVALKVIDIIPMEAKLLAHEGLVAFRTLQTIRVERLASNASPLPNNKFLALYARRGVHLLAFLTDWRTVLLVKPTGLGFCYK
jgi:hypothetical protein